MPKQVNLIFVNLAEYQMNKTVIICIQILFIICLIGWLRIAFKKMLWSETSVLFVMLISGYFLDPLFWFGYYFCFYHGMRALMISSISAKKRYDLDGNFYNSCIDCMADM